MDVDDDNGAAPMLVEPRPAEDHLQPNYPACRFLFFPSAHKELYSIDTHTALSTKN